MYVCHVGSEAGMGMNVPRHDHTCSCHVIGHFIQNTMLQVGVHRSSPLEEGGVGQKKEWTNWLQSWKDKPSINRSVDSGENLFSCWRFGFLQPINAWDPQLKCRLLTNLGWKDVWLWKESFRLFANLERKTRALLFSILEEGRGCDVLHPLSSIILSRTSPDTFPLPQSTAHIRREFNGQAPAHLTARLYFP